MPSEGSLTDAGLEIWPHGIYDLVMQITREYNKPIIEITESGCSYLDTPYEKESGQGPDIRRIEFFRDELAELARAIADGANVRAFHAWSLLDNFEWADGYSQRYGLTYVDFRDQKRTVKDSGLWYGKLADAPAGSPLLTLADETEETAAYPPGIGWAGQLAQFAGIQGRRPVVSSSR